MSNQHTPGPWIVATDKVSVLSITAVDMANQKPCPKVVDCASGYDAMSYEEAQANARLIAAAPELLEALVSMLHLRKMPDEVAECVLDRAVAAIAKAKGSNP